MSCFSCNAMLLFQKGCHREYIRYNEWIEESIVKMELLFINFALKFFTLVLIKSVDFTVITLFLIQTLFNLFGSSSSSPPVVGELGTFCQQDSFQSPLQC